MIGTYRTPKFNPRRDSPIWEDPSVRPGVGWVAIRLAQNRPTPARIGRAAHSLSWRRRQPNVLSDGLKTTSARRKRHMLGRIRTCHLRFRKT